MNRVGRPTANYLWLLVPAVLGITAAPGWQRDGHRLAQSSPPTDSSSAMPLNSLARAPLDYQLPAQDTSKSKPKTTAHHAAKPKPKAAADTSKAKPAEVPPRVPARTTIHPPPKDTTKKPN